MSENISGADDIAALVSAASYDAGLFGEQIFPFGEKVYKGHEIFHSKPLQLWQALQAGGGERPVAFDFVARGSGWGGVTIPSLAEDKTRVVLSFKEAEWGSHSKASKLIRRTGYGTTSPVLIYGMARLGGVKNDVREVIIEVRNERQLCAWDAAHGQSLRSAARGDQRPMKQMDLLGDFEPDDPEPG